MAGTARAAARAMATPTAQAVGHASGYPCPGRPDRVALVADLNLVVNDPESIVADLIATEVAMNQAVPS